MAKVFRSSEKTAGDHVTVDQLIEEVDLSLMPSRDDARAVELSRNPIRRNTQVRRLLGAMGVPKRTQHFNGLPFLAGREDLIVHAGIREDLAAESAARPTEMEPAVLQADTAAILDLVIQDLREMRGEQ